MSLALTRDWWYARIYRSINSHWLNLFLFIHIACHPPSIRKVFDDAKQKWSAANVTGQGDGERRRRRYHGGGGRGGGGDRGGGAGGDGGGMT